jgi:glyoxylase-like metal-dependent hydrolase (beta-lactamase superfamily II)
MMKITRFGDRFVQLTRWPLMFPINCYLVGEDDGFTLIDTGIGGTAKEILAAAKDLGRPIVRIVLTHAHSDHAGSLDELHEALPGAEVIVPQRSVRLLAGDYGLEAGEPQDKVRGGRQICKTQATRTVRAGDRIGSLEVIASPGHTPDHVSFLDVRDRTLIAGDAFQTRGGMAVSGVVRPLFPFPAMATWHKPTALTSAQALRALNPMRLAVGHGRVLEEPLAMMDQAIAVARRAIPEQVTVEV